MSVSTKPAKYTAAEIEEMKRTAFRRLAPKRVQKALDALRTIGNLSHYDHTQTQSAAIWVALDDAFDAAEAKFKEGSAKEERSTFKLPD